MKNKLLLTTVATIAALGVSPLANATTVVTKTYTQTQDIDGATKIEFEAFDLNNDGLYSKSEVGKKLFYVFDRDGNEVIDNIEWDRKSMYTIMPMEKETFKFVDYNDDGYTERSSYTYETFYEESGLIRFDKDKNGLSAAEFIEEGFQSLDDNDNNTIELDEWEEAYTQHFYSENAEQEGYN